MLPALLHALAEKLAQPITSIRHISGGDINQAYVVDLADDRRIFVKYNLDADARMFPCEAEGLRWLQQAAALRTPQVIAAHGGQPPVPAYLVLEMIPSAPAVANFEELLGDGLARLHHSGADCFGLDQDNFIGTLPQDNTPCDSWHEFYCLRRLEPQVRRAIDNGLAPRTWIQRFSRLFARMEERVGPPEPPARLHGDLWSGNILTGPQGEPCLIDPAVYGGHREMDLAMLVLFGGVSDRTLAAYDDRFRRQPEHTERVALFQLYPLLVHVNLFGGSYISSVEQALQRYL